MNIQADIGNKVITMYKHCESNDKYISLHDCHVTKVVYDNGVLTFVFDDGIWILDEHPNNVTKKTVRTDKAEMNFRLESGEPYDVTFYVFEEKMKKIIRNEWDLNKMIKSVNSGQCTIELLYDYNGYNSMIIEGELWSKKKPYNRECELKISVTDVEYYWNNLCEDRMW